MTETDLAAFTEALQACSYVARGRRADDDLVAVYFKILRDQPIDLLVRGLERFARTAETGRRFPTPAEIRAWMPARPRTATPAEISWYKAYAALTPAWWKAHWAAEDERTGRWHKHRTAAGEDG